MLIRDIHLYCSDMDNVDGYPLPKPLNYPAEQAMATRIALKLKELQLDMGDYSDLKLNFTPCLAASTAQHALRTPTAKTAHYVDVGITREVYQLLKAGSPEAAVKLISGIRQALLVLYGKHQPEQQIITDAVDAAISQGEDMEFCLMEKHGLFARGCVMVRLLNSGFYRPRLLVVDRQGNEKLDQLLPDMDALEKLKDIQMGIGKASVHFAYGEPEQASFTYKK